MRVLTLATALGLSVMATPTVQTPTTSQAPARQTETTQAPRVTFPVGAQFAFVNLQRVAAESNEGQVAKAEVEALSQEKLAELEAKNLTLVTQQQKLQQGQTVLSVGGAPEAPAGPREDAIGGSALQPGRGSRGPGTPRQLQLDFQKKLIPILDQVANDKQLQFVLSGRRLGPRVGPPGARHHRRRYRAPGCGGHRHATAAAPSQPADGLRYGDPGLVGPGGRGRHEAKKGC